MLPDRKQYPYSPGPSAVHSSSKKNTVGEIFQECLAFSIFSWKIGSSKPEKLALLNPCIIVPWDLPSTISNKKAFSNAFNRIKSHVHTVMVELILRLGIYLHSSHILSAEGQVAISPHFQRCRTVSAPTEVPRTLGGKNLPLQQAKPKDSKPYSPDLCCLRAPNSPLELHWASAEFRLGFLIKLCIDLKIMDNFSMRRQPKLLNAGFHYFICLSTSAKIWITLVSAAEDLSYFPSKENCKTQINKLLDLTKLMRCNWKVRQKSWVLLTSNHSWSLVSDHFHRKSIMPAKSEQRGDAPLLFERC